MKLSICIPTYEARGMGVAFLKSSLDILKKQTFKDFEVIVSDNSTGDRKDQIEWLCNSYRFVKYYKNSERDNTDHIVKMP